MAIASRASGRQLMLCYMLWPAATRPRPEARAASGCTAASSRGGGKWPACTTATPAACPCTAARTVSAQAACARAVYHRGRRLPNFGVVGRWGLVLGACRIASGNNTHTNRGLGVIKHHPLNHPSEPPNFRTSCLLPALGNYRRQPCCPALRTVVKPLVDPIKYTNMFALLD
jgi:hypothetical protein